MTATGRLGDLVSFLSGCPFKSALFNTDGVGMPLARIRDVVPGRSGTYYSGAYEETYVLADGDYLIGMDGEFNLARWRGGPALLNQRVCKVDQVSDALDLGYLARFLPSALKAIEAVTPFATVKHLSIKSLREIEIPLPPLEEQRRITTILDQADELRAKRREALVHLDDLTQSIFLDMFGVDASVWPTAPIMETCDLVVDCVNRTAPIVDGPTPYKMIRTSNVKNGQVDLSKVRYVEEDVFQRWNRRATPRPGDVLLTREAPVGQSGILNTEEQVFLGQRLMLYRVNRAKLTPEYLLACFNDQFLRVQFDRAGSGSTVKHLPLPACRSFDVPLPPVEMQREFATSIHALRSLKNRYREQLTDWDALFASLQSRALAGEL